MSTIKKNTELKDGVTLTLEISVYEEKNNLDGHIFDGEIKVLREAEIKINGKKVASSYDWGSEVTAESKKMFGYGEKCVATIGNAQIGQQAWDKRSILVREIEKELAANPLYGAYKQQEQKKADTIAKNKKEMEKYNSAVKNNPGYCSICESYCYGDCQS